jgi:hypothetical protein
MLFLNTVLSSRLHCEKSADRRPPEAEVRLFPHQQASSLLFQASFGLRGILPPGQGATRGCPGEAGTQHLGSTFPLVKAKYTSAKKKSTPSRNLKPHVLWPLRALLSKETILGGFAAFLSS